MLGPSARLLQRLFPEPPAAEARRPRFLQEVALEDPDLALALAEQEQKRLLDMIGPLFKAARTETADEGRRRAADAAQAFDAVGQMRALTGRLQARIG